MHKALEGAGTLCIENDLYEPQGFVRGKNDLVAARLKLAEAHYEANYRQKKRGYENG